MLIRRETPADIQAIHDVVKAAFAKGDKDGSIEANLVTELRADQGWLPVLSLVATDPDGTVVGHVACTRGYVGDLPALGLGPLSVRPDRQRSGVGKALVHTALGAADALAEPLVALLGDPAYYGRYGFRQSTEYGITPPVAEWGKYFQVRPLTNHQPSHQGAFRYAEPFNRL